MSKKTLKAPNLGRTLIKNWYGGNKNRKLTADKSMLHTTEIQDGYDWGRLNLQSVTEESSYQEILSIAELTGKEFKAEKLNVMILNSSSHSTLPSQEELEKTKDVHDKHRALLRIPRRPPWSPQMTREQLQQQEREYFLEWRRSLAKLQEDEGILMTPYERNLEFWRQLWRVVERSDVIVQIVDARNPLLFRCEDLEKYVKEVSPDKMNLILVNKADFLTEEHRQYWANYFTSIKVYVVFYSALSATPELIEEESDDESEDKKLSLEFLKAGVKDLETEVEKVSEKLTEITRKLGIESDYQNSSAVLTREQLIDFFRSFHKGTKVNENVTTIGFTGYPNVGKSSTINSLLQAKKVSVSATPGKTKHFQTLFLDKDIMLCDCPGLVMPSFAFTKAEMIINGILPIDQMRDHVPAVTSVANLIPRHILEDQYGIMLPTPGEDQDPNRAPTSEELLNAYAYNRGFMTANGQPDNSRAARYILKDYMNGKLLYCHAPPDVNQADFFKWPPPSARKILEEVAPLKQILAIKGKQVTNQAIDNAHFKQPVNNGAHVKAFLKLKGHKKPKKEKLRRTYAHLDQH